MEMRSIGVDAGEVLSENKFLKELRGLFEQYNVDAVFSHSPFFGYRSGGMDLLLPEYISVVGMEEILKHITTYEMRRPCTVHRATRGVGRPVIYRDGKFYGNGIKLTVEDYKMLDNLNNIEDVYELAMYVVAHESVWINPEWIVCLYRNALAYLSYSNDMLYSCSEYVRHKYPVFDELEALVAMILYHNATNGVFGREITTAIDGGMYERIREVLVSQGE